MSLNTSSSSYKNNRVSLVTFDGSKSSKLLETSDWPKYDLNWDKNTCLEKQYQTSRLITNRIIDVTSRRTASHIVLHEFPPMTYHLRVNGTIIKTSKLFNETPIFTFNDPKAQFCDMFGYIKLDDIEQVQIIVPKIFPEAFWNQSRTIKILGPCDSITYEPVNPRTTIKSHFMFNVPLILVEGLPRCEQQLKIKANGKLIYDDIVDFTGVEPPKWYIRLLESDLTSVDNFQIILDPRHMYENEIKMTGWTQCQYNKEHTFDFTNNMNF